MKQSQTPYRVLFVTACTGKGGAGNSLALLCQYLDRSRIEPVVVMPNEGIIGEKLRRLGVETILAPRLRERFYELRFRSNNPLTRVLSLVRNLWDSVVFVFQLARLARDVDADLIYGNHMMVKIMTVLAGAVTGRPVVLHTRTIYANAVERGLYVSFARAQHVKRIVAVSRAAGANFQALPEKVRVVYNGVALDELPDPADRGTLRRAWGVPGDVPVVGFVGRLVNWKGIDVFMDAAETLAAANPDVHFVVVGDAPVGSTHRSLEDFQAEARERGLGDRMVFTGFRKDAAACTQDFDVLVVPSIFPDPCPRVVLESLAVGTPVVGSASGGIAETVQDGVTGFLARPGDAAEVADRVARILADPELARSMAEEARAAAARNHSARGVARQIQNVILEALGVPADEGDAE